MRRARRDKDSANVLPLADDRQLERPLGIRLVMQQGGSCSMSKATSSDMRMPDEKSVSMIARSRSPSGLAVSYRPNYELTQFMIQG